MVEQAVDIPRAWEEIDITRLSGILLVIGEPDTGKSTFARFLYRRLTEAGRTAAFLDGDPGQSVLGPPATMSLVVNQAGLEEQERRGAGPWMQGGYSLPEDFPPPAAGWCSFVGSVSPHGHMLSMLTGADRLVRAGRQAGAQAIVYDTCGLIDPAQGGYTLKLAKIELLRPTLVFAIQRERELEPLIIPLQRSGRAQVVRFTPSVGARPRGHTSRQSYRAEGFGRYFQDAQPVNLDWRRFAVFPLPQFSLHRLIALEDQPGYTLGLGILAEIDRDRKKFTILTPLPSLEGVRAIRLGSMALDPETYQGTMM